MALTFPSSTRRLPASRPVRSDLLVARAADLMTLIAVGMAPNLGLRVGSFPLTEFFVAFALLGRALQFIGGGIDRMELKKHGFLFAITGICCIGGLVTDTFYGDPVNFDLARAVFTAVGGVLLVATYGTTDARRKQLVTAFAIGGLVLSLSAWTSSVNGRALGFSTHPNLLAHSCLMGLFAALYVADRAPTRFWFWAWRGAAGLALAAIFISGSRGTLLGAGVGLVTYCLLGKQYKLIVMVGLIAYLLGALMVVGIVAVPNDSAIGRLGSGGAAADEQRSEGLKDNLNTIEHFPVFGLGFEPQPDPRSNYLYSHVVYLQAWIACGVVGGVAIILLGLVMIFLPFGQRRPALALACGAMGVAIAWFVTNIFLARDQWIFLTLVFRLCPSPLRGRALLRRR